MPSSGNLPLNFHRDRDDRQLDSRLEELLEESARLGAALEALRGDGAPASRGLHADRTTKPVVKTLSRNRPVKPGRGFTVTPAEPNAVDDNDATRDPAVERAVRQLRQELAAGLRNR